MSIATCTWTASCSSVVGRAKCATSSLLVYDRVNSDGYRGDSRHREGAKEDKAGWSAFLNHLKERGLQGVELIISDACMGLFESAAEFLRSWQVVCALVEYIQYVERCESRM